MGAASFFAGCLRFGAAAVFIPFRRRRRKSSTQNAQPKRSLRRGLRLDLERIQNPGRSQDFSTSLWQDSYLAFEARGEMVVHGARFRLGERVCVGCAGRDPALGVKAEAEKMGRMKIGCRPMFARVLVVKYDRIPNLDGEFRWGKSFLVHDDVIGLALWRGRWRRARRLGWRWLPWTRLRRASRTSRRGRGRWQGRITPRRRGCGRNAERLFQREQRLTQKVCEQHYRRRGDRGNEEGLRAHDGKIIPHPDAFGNRRSEAGTVRGRFVPGAQRFFFCLEPHAVPVLDALLAGTAREGERRYVFRCVLRPA